MWFVKKITTSILERKPTLIVGKALGMLGFIPLFILNFSCSTPSNKVPRIIASPSEPKGIHYLSSGEKCEKTKVITAYSSHSYDHAKVSGVKLLIKRTNSNGYNVKNYYKEGSKRFVSVQGFQCEWVWGYTSRSPKLNVQANDVEYISKKDENKAKFQNLTREQKLMYLKLARPSSTEPISQFIQSEFGRCETPRRSHRGCCSYHGGISRCSRNSYSYTNSGQLICSDGSVSPSCKY